MCSWSGMRGLRCIQETMEMFRGLGIDDLIAAHAAPVLCQELTAWYTSFDGPTPLHGKLLASRNAWGSGEYAAEYAAASYEVRGKFLIGADGCRTVAASLGVTETGPTNLVGMVSVHFSSDQTRYHDPAVLMSWLVNPDLGGSVDTGFLYPVGPWNAAGQQLRGGTSADRPGGGDEFAGQFPRRRRAHRHRARPGPGTTSQRGMGQPQSTVRSRPGLRRPAWNAEKRAEVACHDHQRRCHQPRPQGDLGPATGHRRDWCAPGAPGRHRRLAMGPTTRRRQPSAARRAALPNLLHQQRAATGRPLCTRRDWQ
jgi:hypothetical protein